MIPRDYITEWRKEAPWIENFQVEQDLIISRALVDLFSHPLLSSACPPTSATLPAQSLGRRSWGGWRAG